MTAHGGDDVQGSGAPPELIVLVDERGTPIGSADKAASHHADTPLHLAFSCYVFDGRGRFLATRRAAGKHVWPGVWTNSVCGHPAPGETMVAAIERRLEQELGMAARGFEVALPTYRYTSPPFNGVVENEFCPVFLARAASEPRPDPREVDEVDWLNWDDFVTAARADTGDRFSWWCKDQLRLLLQSRLVERFAAPEQSGDEVPTER
jgi:isopentenyl-diphosphate delta-isomerase